jgi:hypothetical protein
MLQIASGKLFQRPPWRKNELRGVMHTNLWLERENVLETAAGRLMPTSDLGRQRCLVYEMMEQIEDDGTGKNLLISHGIDPYISEFAPITSFGLNATCTTDPDLYQRLIFAGPSRSARFHPRNFVRQVFDETVPCQTADASRFVAFVDHLLGLERRSYKAAIRAIRTYTAGLHRLADDMDLAYTLLVASIESLAQGFDSHIPEWHDYEDSKRTKIDEALAEAPPITAQLVRDALLSIEHVSLARRFRDFTLDHLTPKFFRDEARPEDRPLGRAELPDALATAYRLRSRYVHNLEELPRSLTLGVAYAEAILVDGSLLLSFQGLARLARHTIWEFVLRQSKTESEPYDYHLERPGIVHAPLAPQYWVWRPAQGYPGEGRRRLEGLLDQVSGCHDGAAGATISDLRPLLAQVIGDYSTMKMAERRPFIAMAVIFQCLVGNKDKLEKFDDFWKSYGQELGQPTAEALVSHVAVGQIPDWPIPDHDAALSTYFSLRGRKSGLRAPRSIDAGLALTLAERYRTSCNVGRARELISFAVENYPGHRGLRELEVAFDPVTEIDWFEVVWPRYRRSVESRDAAVL